MKKNNILTFYTDLGISFAMIIYFTLISIILDYTTYKISNFLIDDFFFKEYAIKGLQFISIGAFIFSIFSSFLFISHSILDLFKKMNKSNTLSNNYLNYINLFIMIFSTFIFFHIIIRQYYQYIQNDRSVIWNNIDIYLFSVFFTIILIVVFIYLNKFFIQKIWKLALEEYSSHELSIELRNVFITGLSNIVIFASLYYIYGIKSSSTEIIKEDIISSLYFSIVTWTTLGYGDLQPITSLRLVASFEALMGYIYMALIIGLILNIIKIRVK